MCNSCSNCYCKYENSENFCAWNSKEPVDKMCDEFVHMCSCEGEALYKYKGEYYCFECLLGEFGVDQFIQTFYYLDCEELGSDDDLNEVIRKLSDDIEELE